MNRISNLAALALPVLLFGPAAAAEGDWYVAPAIAYFADADERLLDEDFSGIQVQVGKEMGRHLWLEGLLGYHDIDGFPGQDHLELGFNAVGNLLPDSLFSPYVIGGLGYLRADVGQPDFGGLPPAGTTANDLTATGGLGLKVRFGDSPWALRAEWRLRHAFDDSLTDQIGSIGIQYSFGGRTPAIVAAAAAPAPAPPPDSDGDGVIDVADLCPGTPRGVAVDATGCAPDGDRDGVADDRDQCPGTTPGAAVDANGCEPVRLKTVYFAVESATLLPLATEKLDETVALLKRYPDLQVDIAGHADSTGSDDFNMALSTRRAEVVKRYLEQAGIDSGRLTARGYGESQPAESNDSALGRADNRRVELHAMGQ